MGMVQTATSARSGRSLLHYVRHWSVESHSSFQRLVIYYARHVRNFFEFMQLGCILILLRHL